jgi:hypothetical protein
MYLPILHLQQEKVWKLRSVCRSSCNIFLPKTWDQQRRRRRRIHTLCTVLDFLGFVLVYQLMQLPSSVLSLHEKTNPQNIERENWEIQYLGK